MTIHEQTSIFVLGFFQFLENAKITAASLHGGADGFEGELSDVDLVVERPAFARLPQLIHQYCGESGWQLCQILRHETTAAFFVCSSVRDPSLVVALDACSDYQRNGVVFQTAEELLAAREKLPWGGYGLSEAVELCYRFAKAAAKGKDPGECVAEFAGYPDAAQEKCGAWLASKWGVTICNWDAKGVALGLDAMLKHCRSRPSLRQAGAIARIVGRFAKPTGIVVVTGEGDQDSIADRLSNVFGRCYFRKVCNATRWSPAMWRNLVSSTLILVPRLPSRWIIFLPADSIHFLDAAMAPAAQYDKLAKALAQRCARREGVDLK